MGNQAEREPLGIQPEYIWQEKRLQEIDEAIAKRLETLHNIPVEWVRERNKLVLDIKNRKASH